MASACPDTTNVKRAGVHDGMGAPARNTTEIRLSRGEGERGAAAELAAHLIVAVLLTAPLAAQPSLRSVLLLEQSSAGLPFNTALATAVRLSLNAGSRVRTSFYVEPWMRIDTLVRIMKRVSLEFLV